MDSVFRIQGFPGTTQQLTSTNAAAGLPAASVTRSDRQAAIAVAVTVEANDLRICYDGSAPTTSTGTAFGHILASGQSLRLENPMAIAAFRFVSKTAGAAAVVHVTPEFPTSPTNSF